MNQEEHIASIDETIVWMQNKMKETLMHPRNLVKMHWRECDEAYLVQCIEQKFAEYYHTSEGDTNRRIQKMVDIANFTMMIADQWNRGIYGHNQRITRSFD